MRASVTVSPRVSVRASVRASVGAELASSTGCLSVTVSVTWQTHHLLRAFDAHHFHRLFPGESCTGVVRMKATPCSTTSASAKTTNQHHRSQERDQIHKETTMIREEPPPEAHSCEIHFKSPPVLAHFPELQFSVHLPPACSQEEEECLVSPPQRLLVRLVPVYLRL